MNQYLLLRQPRFLGFFMTQFLGALNDNLFKMGLIILIAYELAHSEPQLANNLANACTAAFVLPFILFSTLGGQLADKFDHSRLIRHLKNGEILITLIAAMAFHFKAWIGLIILLMLMGVQSALFGPVKYSYLPKQLTKSELIGGNGLVEMATFLAILLGTLLGGSLMAHNQGIYYLSGMTLMIALIGRLTAQFIPASNPNAPSLRLNFYLISDIFRHLKLTFAHRTLGLLLIAISWFWFLGALFLTQIGNYIARVVYGDPLVVTVLIACLAFGIGLGALSCERIMNKEISKRWMIWGACGMGLCGVDFSLAHLFFPPPLETVTIKVFFMIPAYWHSGFALFGLGVFGAIYIVPLYALMQHLSPPHQCARIIATNNLINSVSMVVSALFAFCGFALGLTIPGLLMITALMNGFVIIGLVTFDREYWHAFKAGWPFQTN